MTTPGGFRNYEMNVGGVRVEGFSNDSDAFMPPSEIEGVTVVPGGDGTHERFDTGERGGEVVIKLQPSSPTVPKFHRMIRQQQLGDRVNWDLHAENLVSGTRLEGRNGVCTKWPAGETVGGSVIGTQQFTFDYQELITTPGRGTAGPR